ncbi:MAG: hypothetical protein ACK4XJ_04885 [Fimbriimonadaceae bacterium]
MRIAIAGLLAWGLVGPGFAYALSQDRVNAMRTDAGATLLGPPKLVATGKVHGMAWSSSGKQLAVLVQDGQLSRVGAIRALAGKEPEPAEVAPIRLLVYDVESGVSRHVVNVDPHTEEISLMAFPEGSPALIFLARGARQNLDGTTGEYALIGRATANQPGFTTLKRMEFSAAGWHWEMVSEWAQGGAVEVAPESVLLAKGYATGTVEGRDMGGLTLIASPNFPAAYIIEERLSDARIEMADGRLVRGGQGAADVSVVLRDGSVRAASPSKWSVNEMVRAGWSKTGDRPIIQVEQVRDGKLHTQFVSADAANPAALYAGPTEAMHDFITLPAGPIKGNWTVVERGAARAAGQSFWLTSQHKGKEVSTLVTPFAQSAEIAGSGTAVAYANAEGCFVRDVYAFDNDVADHIAREAAMDHAKQVGLALLMYAADYDDTLLPGSDLEVVLPYVKNRESLDRFVFTFSGTRNMRDIQSPSETVLGYVPGPGGRAIVHADGSVRWRPDP